MTRYRKKPPTLVYLDDRAIRFEGTFPTAQDIHNARPWNKPLTAGPSSPPPSSPTPA